MEQLAEIVEKNELTDYKPLAAELLEKFEAKDIVAAAIRSLTKEPDDTPVKITEERPLPSRNSGSRDRGGFKGSRGGGRSHGGGRGYGGGGGSRRGSRDGGADVEIVQVQVQAVQEANRKDNDTPREMTTSSPGFFLFYI